VMLVFQLRAIDRNRFLRLRGRLDAANLKIIEDLIREILGL
jgi:hypothetical protein